MHDGQQDGQRREAHATVEVESMGRIAIIRAFPSHRGREGPRWTAPPPDTTPTEIIHVDDRAVACDGGDGALGHPRVFLRIEDESGDVPVLLAPLRAERRSGPRQRTLTPEVLEKPRGAPPEDAARCT